MSKGVSRRTDTHCANQHPWSTENTRYDRKGRKECRICDREKRSRVKRVRNPGGEGPRERTKRQLDSIQAAWEQLLASPDREYKTAMLESKAEYDAWLRDQERTARDRQQRGILGQPAKKRNAEKAAEVAA